MGTHVSWHIQNGHHGLQVEVMGRFALARAVRSETPRRTLDCRHQPQLPPTPAPTYTHKDGGTKKTDTKN